MRSFTRLVATLGAATLLLTACGGDDEGEVAGDFDLVSDGTLTVCSDIPYAPFEFEDPDSDLGYSGFDIDLMQAMADELGLDVEVVATGFEGLTSGATMSAGTCDLAASAMTITEEREEQVDFTEPYYDAVQSLLVPDGSEIGSIDDLDDSVVVGVQSGTTGEAYAEENVPGAEIRSFENTGDLFTAMESGQIDAILQDQPVNVEYARDNEADVIEEYDTGESYGFALEQGREDELLEALDEALASVRDDGTYDEIYDEYFGT
ncbi:MAG: basic amino acid ABC transporter substrate-binding protein [Nitriliruptoraceae bacterium]